MRVVIAVITVGLAAVAAIPLNPQRIVGGAVTNIEQYPNIVALMYSWGGTFRQSCGGTIITTRAILTAAHCPYGDVPSWWRVRVGSSWANTGGSVYSIDSVSIHPGYNTRTLDCDIAIMRTIAPITYTNVVQAASVAGPNYYVGDNEVVWAAGWGTVASGGSSSEQLRHVQIWSVNQSTCAQRYAKDGGIITENMLCSGWLDVGGRDQCQGDSGGPLYHNGVVIGICSWGFGCALPQYPGVNTRVSRFSSWIQSNA